MESSRLFFEADVLDVDEVWTEAWALARLVAAVGAAALVPMALQWLVVETLGFASVFVTVLSLATQFVLAVGTGVVALYVVARGVQLADA
ncbi:hypothetical protein [Halobacterium yunchengense]|uniref:hypothetical protein n=1 Tax=Halobacterium yunchengense TaxID=3108497 RepID=UPI00300AF861